MIQPKYWGASDFHNGVAIVCQEDTDHDQGIIYIDKKGNIIKTFLDVLKENSSKQNIFMKNYYSVIANPGVQMRSNPNPNGEKIMLIPFGEKIKVLKMTNIAMKAEGLQGFWYFVEYNKKQGYVFSGFLSKISIKNLYERYFLNIYGHFDTPTTKIYLGLNTEELFTIDPSGIIYVFDYEKDTDNTVSFIYIPQISLAEGFWFVKNYMPEVKILKLGDLEINTLFKYLGYPINDGQIKLRVEDDISLRDLTIRKDRFGYVRVML